MSFSDFCCIIMGLFFLDIGTLGITLLLFKLNPPYRHLLKKGILIKDDAANFYNSWNNNRYSTIILTAEYIIIANSYLTSVINISVNSIKTCTVKDKKKSTITLQFIHEGKNEVFSFKTKHYQKWVKALKIIGVEYTEV